MHLLLTRYLGLCTVRMWSKLCIKPRTMKNTEAGKKWFLEIWKWHWNWNWRVIDHYTELETWWNSQLPFIFLKTVQASFSKSTILNGNHMAPWGALAHLKGATDWKMGEVSERYPFCCVALNSYYNCSILGSIKLKNILFYILK